MNIQTAQDDHVTVQSIHKATKVHVITLGGLTDGKCMISIRLLEILKITHEK